MKLSLQRIICAGFEFVERRQNWVLLKRKRSDFVVWTVRNQNRKTKSDRKRVYTMSSVNSHDFKTLRLANPNIADWVFINMEAAA